MNYFLKENGIGNHNGFTVLNDKIHDEQLHEYSIVEREVFIDRLIDYIAECKTPDRHLMMSDLKMLMSWEDKYILSSNSTNSYIKHGDSEFDKTCEELLDLNTTL